MNYILPFVFSTIVLLIAYFSGVFDRFNNPVWIDEVGLIANIASYISPLLPFIISFGAFRLARTLSIPTSYTQESRGKIVSIEFMGTKANMISVGVHYENITKIFEYIKADFALRHNIGESVIIKYAEGDPTKARLDITETDIRR